MRASLSVILIILAVIWRVAPHPWNFAPAGAIALFAGATFDNRRAAFLVPLVAMFAGDALLEWTTGRGFHSLMPLIYATYALITCLGVALRQRRSSALHVALGATASAVIFFVTSNFGVWLFGTTYAKSLEGLVACYIAAIPFFDRTLAGDLFFAALFFSAFAAGERAILRLSAERPGS